MNTLFKNLVFAFRTSYLKKLEKKLFLNVSIYNVYIYNCDDSALLSLQPINVVMEQYNKLCLNDKIRHLLSLRNNDFLNKEKKEIALILLYLYSNQVVLNDLDKESISLLKDKFDTVGKLFFQGPDSYANNFSGYYVENIDAVVVNFKQLKNKIDILMQKQQLQNAVVTNSLNIKNKVIKI